jgi:hypothetical protein
MGNTKTQEMKNIITDIAVRKLEIQKLEKELAKMESEQNQKLWRRYEA